MTIEEIVKIACLCNKFSSLTDENKNYALKVTKTLLRIQKPEFPARESKNQKERKRNE
jgi:hypothetical protein